ncbi:MAG: guanylate kinase [Proteobacteria bacterium]|nr:guanylate kinase [Pseudomonadota bacterium]
MKKMANLFVIAAPSGAGKTSLVKALVESMKNIRVSISHTTRPQRSSEKNGVNYYFIEQKQFDQMVQENRFLEYANVFGQCYGTSKDWVLEQLQKGSDVILEIDWQGATQIRSLVPDCISIFIFPPSRLALKERLKNRGQDNETVIQRRLAEATIEMSHYQEFNYTVINDDFEHALSDLKTIVLAERLKTPRQATLHETMIRQLLED